MKFNQFHASNKGTMQFDQTVIHIPQSTSILQQTAIHNPQFEKSQSSQGSDIFEETGFDANDRTMDSFALSESLGTQMSGLNLNDSPSKYNSPYYSSPASIGEDRRLTGKEQYDLTYARNEFDIEEDFDEVVEAKENQAELN